MSTLADELRERSDALNAALAKAQKDLLSLGYGLGARAPIDGGFLILTKAGLVVHLEPLRYTIPLQQASRLVRCLAAHAIVALREEVERVGAEESQRVVAALAALDAEGER